MRRVAEQRHALHPVPAVPYGQGVDPARADGVGVGDQGAQVLGQPVEMGEHGGLGGGRVGEVDGVQLAFAGLERGVDVQAAIKVCRRERSNLAGAPSPHKQKLHLEE